MNELARQLIHDLRFDAHTRKHFSINSWTGRATCGTVGCIAGTAIYRAWPESTENGSGIKVSPQRYRETIAAGYKTAGYSSYGAYILGLPEESSDALFLPDMNWKDPLVTAGVDADFIRKLSHNERPSLDTVEKMIAFAKALPKTAWHPSHCANALENLLGNERRYVDWAEAWCEPEAVS